MSTPSPPTTNPNPNPTPNPTTPSQTNATFTSHVSTYQAALNSLFTGSPSQTESDLSLLFTPTFIQRSDNSTRDFLAFVKHIQWLREILPPGSVNVTVTHFLRSGNQIAERHSGDPVALPDGRRQCGETFMWVQVAEDGRIEWLVETVKKSSSEAGEEGEGTFPLR